MSLAPVILEDLAQILAEQGRTVQIMAPDDRWYNPATGGYTPTYNDMPGQRTVGLLLNYERAAIDGSSIISKDRRCIVSAKGLTRLPSAGDKICVDPDGAAEIYNVVSAKPHELNDLYFAHVLQVRNVAG